MDVLEVLYGRRGRADNVVASSSRSMAFQHHNSSKDEGGAMDELLANAGYSVQASELAHVAQRLGAAQEAGFAHHSSDAVHYNPSDLAGWIECMIDELTTHAGGQHQNPATDQLPTPTSTYQGTFMDDFTGLPYTTPRSDSHPSALVYHPSISSSEPPRPLEAAGGSKAVSAAEHAGEQESSGVRLVHLLLACAEAVQRGDHAMAEDTVRRIQLLASPQGGPMGKVAAHFVEALARRIYGVASQDSSISMNQTDSLSELLHFHFYETCPYLKFAHFTANQAILEAFEGEKQVHVIDFNLMHGLQWPALIQALALRPGGPPLLRLTGIGPPQPGGNDVLQEIGMKLAQLAESVNVEFNFRGVVALKLDDVKPWMLQVRQGEAVAVNSVLQLHRLLYSDGPMPAIDEVLQSVRSLNPKILTIVEHEANHNTPVFLDRFMEALHYYSTMFDSLEACNLPPQSSEQMLAEMYLGKEICNIVACEGVERVERHETLAQWRQRMVKAGFQPLNLGLNAFKQASMLLTLFSGEGYRVEENSGCLTLGWHSRPLIAASAWKCV